MAAARASVEGLHPDDAVVTSCQRLEAYGFGACTCGAPEQMSGFAALERLSAVAGGLESVVLGEDQVTGQVRAAFADASGRLRAVADVAIAAARALRAETNFDSHAGHLLDKALRLSTMTPPGQLLVLGVGAMGKLVAERAAELGFQVTVAARREPAGTLPGRFVELGQVPGLPPLDVIVGCLGSGAGEIAPRVLPASRLLIDLGTPRNFNVPSGPGVIAISDMLEDEHQRPHAMARRRALRERLGVILRARLSHAAGDGASPVGALRAEVEAIRRQEVERARRLHPEVDPEVLDRVTRSLVDKVLHRPTARIKALEDEELARQFAAFFRE
jgi:glutamyl-tRNA reductase